MDSPQFREGPAEYRIAEDGDGAVGNDLKVRWWPRALPRTPHLSHSSYAVFTSRLFSFELR